MTPVMGAVISIIVGVVSLLGMVWVVSLTQRLCRASERPVMWGFRGEVQHNSLRDNVPAIPQPLQALHIADAFDPEFCTLWDTQMPALSMICQRGADGIHLDELEPTYHTAARRYPELYEGTGVEGWVVFLEDCGLVCRQKGRVFITPAGSDFINSCTAPLSARRANAPL